MVRVRYVTSLPEPLHRVAGDGIMYRQRLRTRTGCIRCRQRRVKCDEVHPACSFCSRWNLPCIWPSDNREPSLPQSRDNEMQLDSTPTQSDWIDRAATQIAVLSRFSGQQISYDPFQSLPGVNQQNLGEITESLQSFFLGASYSAFQPALGPVNKSLFQSWFETCFASPTVCCSLIAYCTKFRSKRTRRPSTTRVSLEFETRALSLLRAQIESGDAVEETTLQAASWHFALAAFEQSDASRMQVTAAGVHALIRARGGPDVITDSASHITLHSLLACDTYNAWLTGELPCFRNITRPPRPCSLDEMYQSPEKTTAVMCLDPAVIEVFQNFSCLFFFLNPTNHTRQLSTGESWYIFKLIQYIDCQVNVLQACHSGARSLSDIAILAMVLLRYRKFAEGVQQSIMIMRILQRLRAAIFTCETDSKQAYQSISLWASIIAIVTSFQDPENGWFSDFVLAALTERYGQTEWPQTWVDDLRQELRRLLWHEGLEARYTEVCSKLRRSQTEAES